MKRSVVICLALILVAWPALASHDKSDVATTDDGATYIGEIKSVQYATLSLNTNPAGVISIEWRYVTGLTSKFQYRIELTAGVRHFGTLGTPDKPGNLKIVTADGDIEVGLSEVVQIVPVEHGFWKRLDGSVNFGLSYTQANEALQYNLSTDATYRTRRNYASLSQQSIFNSQSDGETTNQHHLSLVLVQPGRKTWGAFEIGQLESNPAQGYDLRSILGGGTTNFLIESSKEIFGLNLGAVYNREEVTDGSETDDTAELLLGFAFRLFKMGSHAPSVQLSLTTFTDVNDGRFRANLNFNINWKVVGDFKFNFQVINNYDSSPPGEDSNKNNLSVVTSVGYTF